MARGIYLHKKNQGFQKGHKIFVGTEKTEFKKGHKVSNKIREKISIGNKNKHHSLKTEFKKGDNLDNKNNNWKGDKAGKVAIHRWVEKRKPKPKLCEFCHKEKDYLGRIKLQLANLNNHIYKKNLEDWRYGHQSCHEKFDWRNKRKWL